MKYFASSEIRKFLSFVVLTVDSVSFSSENSLWVPLSIANACHKGYEDNDDASWARVLPYVEYTGMCRLTEYSFCPPCAKRGI